MILLDSDHLTILKHKNSARYVRLAGRLLSEPAESIGTTIGCVEEQMRGWLAAIAKERLIPRQVITYRELGDLFGFFSGLGIAPFSDEAAQQISELRSARIRIATMDLKIASIALVNNARLLTGNKTDFEQVPGLRFENWMD
jgi:tRNA(fMet)-specific endonuclease VapC